MTSSSRRLRLGLALAFASAAPLAFAACSSTTTIGPGTVLDASSEGGEEPEDGGRADSTTADGTTVDAPIGSCEGDCKKTTLVADFGGKTRPLDRAQLGTQTRDGGAAELYVEAHAGGSTACPTMNSPSPERTLIVNHIPRGVVGSKVTDKEGLTSAFLDFAGDLGLPPATEAISVNVTVVAEDKATPPAWVAFDVTAYFREGEVRGHAYATYCASLSE